jgi:hypothetical protein
MIRVIAKLFAVAVVLIAFLPVQPSSAANFVAFVSATAVGGACTQAAPCGNIETAIGTVSNSGGRIVCETPVQENSPIVFAGAATFVFDCPSTSWLGGFNFFGSNITLKFQHIDFSGIANGVLKVNGSGTLIFEDCVFEEFAGVALEIFPNGPLNLVITNSRISNSGAGVVIKPAAGGSVTATFDRVTIADNMGGGVKADATNGPINLAISNSTITKNAAMA